MSLHVSITSQDGIPDLRIDGKLHSRMVGREFGREDMETACLRHLGKTQGLRLYMIKSPLKNSTGWDGRTGYDYRPHEEMLERYLAAAPADMLFIIHVGMINHVPYAWLEDHEDELVTFDGGLRWAWPSFGSDIWLHDFTDACARFVSHFERSRFADRIAGYVPVHLSHEWGGSPLTCEGQYGDVSPAMRRHFQGWLRQHYGNVSALRAAWNDPTVDFATATVPSRQVHEDWQNGPRIQERSARFGTRVLDYRRCCHANEERITLETCRVMKAACGPGKLIGVMANCSRHAPRVMASPDIDFFHKPQSYHNRNFGVGNFLPQHVLGSVHAHGKMMLQQSDLNTHLLPHIVNRNLDPSTTERNTNSEWETLETMTRDVACVLQHQCGFYWVDGGPGQFWNWERAGFNVPHYHKLWFDTPAIREHIGRLQGLIDENQRRRPRPAAEVAFITSERSSALFMNDHKTAGGQDAFGSVMQKVLRSWVLPDTAVPFDEYVLEDWDSIPRSYKVYIFADALSVDPGLRDSIRRKLAAEGATAIWQYAPGYICDNRIDLAAMHQLTGLRFQVSHERDFLQIELGDPAHPLFNGVAVRSYGSDLDYRIFARECNWFQWPKDPEGYQFAPRFSVQDPGAEVLGRFRGTGEAGLVVKDGGCFRSVYTGAPCIPAGLLRNLFRSAGVHLYADQGQLVYANQQMVAVRFRHDGDHTIALPRRATVVDALSGETVGSNTDHVTVRARYGACRIFWLEPAP
jgi:hypothetical protein